MRMLLIGFAVGLAGLVACGDGGTAAAGESCVTTADCGGSLVCTNQVCTTSTGGSLTPCDLSYAVSNEGGKDFGEPCDQNNECRYGACVKPGTGGNITNDKFGFCSRGCDCDDNAASRLTAEEKTEFTCLYPSGFKAFHHVLVQCDTVADCQAIDARYTACKMPNTGGVLRVCHAL